MNRLVVRHMIYQDLYWWNSPMMFFHHPDRNREQLDMNYDRNLLLQVL